MFSVPIFDWEVFQFSNEEHLIILGIFATATNSFRIFDNVHQIYHFLKPSHHISLPSKIMVISNANGYCIAYWVLRFCGKTIRTDRIGPSVQLVCHTMTWRLSVADYRMKQQKPSHNSGSTVKFPPFSNVRAKAEFRNSSPTMVPAPYEWRILEQNAVNIQSINLWPWSTGARWVAGRLGQKLCSVLSVELTISVTNESWTIIFRSSIILNV